MDEEFVKRLIDRFYGWELADLLDIDSDQIVEAFTDIVTENKEMLEDYLNHGR